MVMKMNKRKLAKLYKEMSSENIPITKGIEEIDEFLETVKEAIAIDGRIKFLKRGTFEILARKPRVVSNPATRENMIIYPCKIVKFKASKKIK